MHAGEQVWQAATTAQLIANCSNSCSSTFFLFIRHRFEQCVCVLFKKMIYRVSQENIIASPYINCQLRLCHHYQLRRWCVHLFVGYICSVEMNKKFQWICIERVFINRDPRSNAIRQYRGPGTAAQEGLKNKVFLRNDSRPPLYKKRLHVFRQNLRFFQLSYSIN